MTHNPTHVQVSDTLTVRRIELGALIREHFGGHNDAAARAIREVSGKPVSQRSIQAWLIEPTRASSRNCPDWAFEALRLYIADPKYVKPGPSRNSPGQFFRGPFAWAAEIADQHAVRFAEDQRAREKAQRIAWNSVQLAELPKMLFELQRCTENELESHGRLIRVLLDAIKNSNDQNSSRDLLERYIRESDLEQFEIRNTRKAIEQGTGEFANDEGIPSSD